MENDGKWRIDGMMKKKRYGCGTTGELLICD
jgi:hypothetical protein